MHSTVDARASLHGVKVFCFFKIVNQRERVATAAPVNPPATARNATDNHKDMRMSFSMPWCPNSKVERNMAKPMAAASAAKPKATAAAADAARRRYTSRGAWRGGCACASASSTLAL